MKRINILITGTLVCALVVAWHTSQPSLADEKQTAKPAKWEHVTFKSERGKDELKIKPFIAATRAASSVRILP